ncbi:hypothetical protein BVG79_01863 [Ketogulonicigenium robustum]|uniref:Uncharacterized protein n=1 Tax=Ketogulonicigenium robustum TaxID=92947 RepID=A0A1W6P119_9RHOB|nr:hypothetical protein [Ketogulonicigenium robustum]ARO15205.1 hypothetical protein BVG79_01863 [Ketogulonicigenium robustum]
MPRILMMLAQRILLPILARKSGGGRQMRSAQQLTRFLRRFMRF